MTLDCPCHSKKPYDTCCKPWHDGKWPETALQLMRSRYSAYKLKLVEYLIKTTHPSNPLFKKSREDIEKDILLFASNTEFVGLEIIEFQDGVDEAFVTFFAKLQQAGQDVSFQEKSRFLKVDGHWLYHSAASLI